MRIPFLTTSVVAVLLEGFAACSPVVFSIDTSPASIGHRFRFVDNTVALSSWPNKPDLPKDWAVKRWKKMARYVADWFALQNTADIDLYTIDSSGNCLFKPNPDTQKLIQRCALEAGLVPMIITGTTAIPKPLIEGGFAVGDCGFQVRQPSDYKKWDIYLDSMFKWLVSTFGKSEVRRWGWCFGIESDMQIKAVYPGTQKVMNAKDNRQEFLRMLDHFVAAAERNLGKNLYIGCYWAFPMQAEEFIRHWGEGINFATGEIGTRIGWCGISDCLLVGGDSLSPFSPPNRPLNTLNNESYAVGLVWKYDYIANLLNQYPALRKVEVHLPEVGYLENQCGIGGRAGVEVPVGFSPADYRGCALHALRSIAYSRCPRITRVANRYALGTADLYDISSDEVKPPVFNAVRIEKKMDGGFVLPVQASGAPESDTSEVRACAVSKSFIGKDFKVLAVNFNRDWEASHPEKIIIRLCRLSKAKSLKVNPCLINSFHNNWWEDWTSCRESQKILHASDKSSGRLHRDIFHTEKYASSRLDVPETWDASDRKKRGTKAADCRKQDTLRCASKPFFVPVVDGIAEIPFELMSFATLFLEVTVVD